MQKIYSVQAARGLAALMVVAFHSLSIQEKYLPGSMLLPQLLKAGQTGVDLFFAISGFVMVLATQGKTHNIGDVGNFIKNRFFRIYPTYWVYFCMLLPLFLFMPGIINSSQGGQVDLVSSFFLTPNDRLPLLMVAWSLTHEIWFYLVFAGVLLLPGKARLISLGAWFLLVLVSANWEFVSPVLRVMTHAFTIEFILGAFSAYAYIRLRSNKNSSTVAIVGAFIGVLMLCVGWAALKNTAVDVVSNRPLGRAILIGGGYALLISSAALLEFSGKLKINDILKTLGDISYSVYLSHVLILSLFGRIWYTVGQGELNSILGHTVFWLITFSGVVIGGYLAFILIERPILKLTLHKSKARPGKMEANKVPSHRYT